MATIDLASTYTLTNAYTGEGRLLAINSADTTTPQLLAPSTLTSPPPHAQWFLSPGDTPPFYRLHILSGGPSRALDVFDSSTGRLHLTQPNAPATPGQFWRFDVWADAASDGYTYRLSNNLTGTDMHLDVYGDTLGPHLAGGSATGQYWKLGPVGATPRTTPSVSTTSTAATSGVSSATGTWMAAGVAGERDILSTGAIAGIAIGSVAVLVLAAALAAFLVLRRPGNSKTASSGSSFVEGLLDEEKAGEGTKTPPRGSDAPGERERERAHVPPVELSAVQLDPRELPALQVVRELPDKPYR